MYLHLLHVTTATRAHVCFMNLFGRFCLFLRGKHAVGCVNVCQCVGALRACARMQVQANVRLGGSVSVRLMENDRR